MASPPSSKLMLQHPWGIPVRQQEWVNNYCQNNRVVQTKLKQLDQLHKIGNQVIDVFIKYIIKKLFFLKLVF